MIYVCVPVHNEASTVGLVLWKVRQVFTAFEREYQIIACDDDSTDGTADVLTSYARVLPLTVIRHRARQGYAHSLEELVQRMQDVNPAGFMKTIQEYNAAVKRDVKFDPNIKDGKRTVGLVSVRAEGRRRLYSLDGETLRSLYDWIKPFERLWNERLDRLDHVVSDLHASRTRGATRKDPS